MPKVVPKSRFRSRKINFKSRLPVLHGSFDLGEDALDYGEVGEDGQAVGESSQPRKVETGVDKEEEHELHLQNAISASAAVLSGRGIPRPAGAPGSPPKSTVPFIPTPDATGHAANWEALYPVRNFAEPSTYIRFSDTVEDVTGVAYTMDEDDEEWLEQYNEQAAAEAIKQRDAPAAPTDGTRSSRNSPKKDKSKDMPAGPLSEDEFEVIMDLFEVQTEEKVPILHLDLSRIPNFVDFEEFFDSQDNSRLFHLKNAAKLVYIHWKERRIKRGGRIIMPQLDHDETREDNPYCCFRRRDPKNVRKTRRTDAQNVDRLVRLSTDLAAARDLMVKVLERERIKREALITELYVFEARTQLRDLKRKLGEKDGDESLLIGKREKRRKPNPEEPPIQSLKVPLRLPRLDSGHTVPATPAIAEPIVPYRDRTASIMTRIDRDIAKKKEADRDFDDFTDSAYVPPHLAIPARYWRTPDSVALVYADGRTQSRAATFGQAYPHALGAVRPSFRRRTGRGGRIFLDRTTARSILTDVEEDSDLEDEERGARERLADRWKFDSDASDLPGAGVKQILDDFDPVYQSARINLFRQDDLRSLHPATFFLEEAYRWVSKEPDKRPPTQVVGKLPIKALPPPPPVQPIQTLPMPPPPQMPGQPAQAQAVLNSMQQAANHAHQVAAATQVHLKRSSSATPLVPNGSPMPNLRRMPSGSLPNGMPLNGALQQQQQQAQLAQWQAMNGMVASGKMDPQTYQNIATHLSQQLQQNGVPVNGLHLPNRGPMPGFPFVQTPPAGANGLPATSRLAGAPYSAGPMHSPLINGADMVNGPSPEQQALLANVLVSPSRSATPSLPAETSSPALRTRRSPQMKSGLQQQAFLQPQAA